MSGQGNPQEGSRPSQVEVFERLRLYPFVKDPEFARGLAIILNHPNDPASEAEINRSDDLVLQAKCFYFSRKERLPQPLDIVAYKAWVESEARAPHASQGETNSSTVSQQIYTPTTNSTSLHDHANQETGPSPPTQEPAYPSSFAHIVELITTGQPIPGIQQIPDTVLVGHETPSIKPRRRKPWEKEDVKDLSSS